MKTIAERLNSEKLILAGTFGNLAQKYNLRKFDYHKSRFQNHTKDLTGFYEVLNIVYPEIVKEVFEKYAKLGIDMLRTNTVRANEHYLRNLDLSLLSYEINLASAKLAREIATKYSLINKSKVRYVLGEIGSIDKEITYDEASEIYTQQFKGLLAGKVDGFLFTGFIRESDLTNVLRVLNEILNKRRKTLPVILVQQIEKEMSDIFITNKLLEFYKNEFQYIDIIAIGVSEELDSSYQFTATQNLVDTINSPVILYPSFQENVEFSLSSLTSSIDIFIQYDKVKIFGAGDNLDTDYFKYLIDTLKLLKGD